jgi:hypothetical protein
MQWTKAARRSLGRRRARSRKRSAACPVKLKGMPSWRAVDMAMVLGTWAMWAWRRSGFSGRRRRARARAAKA